MNPKEILGQKIAEFVEDGQIIGVGTGTTVSAALKFIAERVKQDKLDVSFVPTSFQTVWELQSFELKVLDLSGDWSIDWGFDGADAVDAKGNAIKGKGAAMLQEKILAARCPKYYLVADESKYAEVLLDHAPVPVEVNPNAKDIVAKGLSALGATDVSLRLAQKKHGPVITEAGNLILDTKFKKFDENLERDIKAIVGVVESGLFLGYADQVFISNEKEVKEIL